METWVKAAGIVVLSAGVLYVGKGYIDGSTNARARGDWAYTRAAIDAPTIARGPVVEPVNAQPSPEGIAAQRGRIAACDAVWAEYDALPENLKDWTAIYVYSARTNGRLRGLPQAEQRELVSYNGLQFRRRLGTAMVAGEVGKAHGDELRSYTPSTASVDRCRQLALTWLASEVAGQLRDHGVEKLTCGAQSWAL